MKRIAILAVLCAAISIPARIVQKPIMSGVWQIDRNYTSKKYDTKGFSTIHGDAIYEYQWGNRAKEFLILVVESARGRIVYTVAKEENGKRVQKDRWSGCFGSFGSGNEQFKYPRGICIKPADSTSRYLHIFVADEGNNRIVQLRFDKQNRELSWVRTVTSGSLDAPKDVACSWLDEENGKAILAVASSGNDRIAFYRVNSDNTVDYLTGYGSTGSGSGQFKRPSSLAFVEEIYTGSTYTHELFVADRGNKRIVRLMCKNFPNPTIYWLETKSMNDPASFVSAVDYNSEGFPENVVFIHEPNLRRIVAYDIRFFERLYEIETNRSCFMSFNEGECVLSEEWTYNSGLKYFWLDSEFKNAGAIPNVFKIGDHDVMIKYELTGGGTVTIKVKDRQGNVIKTIEEDDPRWAGRHWAVWDGKKDNGQYVSAGFYDIHLWVEDYYAGIEGSDYPVLKEHVVILVEASNTKTLFHTGFEDSDSPAPQENDLLGNQCGDTAWAGIVGAGNGVTPHSGSKMYKLTGRDTSSDDAAGRVEFYLFKDSSVTAIDNPMYLSFWVYAKEFPEDKKTGRALLAGQFTQSSSSYWFGNWENYGRILDTRSNPIHPAECTPVVADGQWHQYVYTFTPAAGADVAFFSVIYYEAYPRDTGDFTVYFDDIQLTSIYPGGKYEWYPEHFANGDDDDHTNGDCNFDMTFWARNMGPEEDHVACFPWIFLYVDGNGDFQGGSCCECLDDDTVWIHPTPGPGIRMELPYIADVHHIDDWPSGEVDSSTKISWWQFDRAHALILGALLEEADGDTNWLYWAWNAPAKWNSPYHPGYVDMGDVNHEKHYNEWEYIPPRNIVLDYYSEYEAVPVNALSVRVAHYCKSNWEGDSGGVIADLYIGGSNWIIIDSVPPDSLPDPLPFAGATRARVTGGTILAEQGWAPVRGGDKCSYLGWKTGEGMMAKSCALYLSRDGGQTFEYQIADSLAPGELEPLDTIIIDDTLVTVRYVLRGTYEWHIASPPTDAGQIKLVVTDSSSNTFDYESNLFQIHIPSALRWPLEGNAPLVAVNYGTGGIHLVWTTWGEEDTTDRYVLYTHSADGVKWDTLDSPAHGRRPAVCLTSQGKPVIVYNETAGGLYVSQQGAPGCWESTNLTPSSPSGADFTANCVGGFLDYDTVHFALFARMDTATLVLYAKEKCPISSGLSDPYTLGTYPGEPEADYAPCIALDRNGLPHIAYRIADTTYYAHFTGSGWVRDNFPSDTTCHPSIFSWGGNVYVLYRNPDRKLARKLGYLDGTLTSEQIVTATTGAILDPRLVGGGVVVFTDNQDTTARRVRFSQYDSEVNGFSYPVPISDAEHNASSPQGTLLPDSTLWLEWTEDRTDYNKIAYLQLDPLYEIPCCELDAGWAGTPYTSYRDTVAGFDAATVDVGADSLVYAFSGMDDLKRHTVLLEFFFEDENVESTNYIVACGSELDTLEIEEGYVNQFFYGLSSGYSTIPVKVYAQDSIPAQLARTVIYETQGAGAMGLAGARGKITPVPVRFALYQNAPNPFVASTAIRYALPYACKVNLSVYDVSGRRVCVLHKGEQKAGLYTLQWNGKDNHNVGLAAGVYFIRFEADDYVESRKAVLLH